MLYDYKGKRLDIYAGIKGDGVTDDTAALQALVNQYGTLHLPSGLKVLLKRAVTIDISKCNLFDGGNSTFIVDGDHAGFVLSGTMTGSMTADPTSLTSKIINAEADFILENCRITSSNETQGTGVQITGCFEANVERCYIHHINTGISVSGRNRNLRINDNHIYCCYNTGIYFMPQVNLHQFNLDSNMISYCAKCIWIDSPDQIANWQLSGNDIETSTYPTGDRSGFRCLLIEGGSNTVFLAEIEVTGNTIQGHGEGNCIIEMKGTTATKVVNVSIVGNHISNSSDKLIDMAYVKGAAFGGNTSKDVTNYAYNIADCDTVSVVGESMINIGGLVTVSGTTTGILVANCTAQTNKADPIRTVGDNARLVAKNILINGSEYSGA